jgi:hypothetical protein
LADANTGTWNAQLIHNIFYPHDADVILRLNPPDTSRKDFLAWHYESNGMFSVRSAYKLAYNLKNNSQKASLAQAHPGIIAEPYGNLFGKLRSQIK